jgi:epoxyqueuosine reductase
MKLTSEMIKNKAKELGLDMVGIANIERYENAPPMMNPKNYFPEAKSVIVTVMRIPRGTYRGIEEGTHWHNYTYYAYNRLNTLFRPSPDLCTSLLYRGSWMGSCTLLSRGT